MRQGRPRLIDTSGLRFTLISVRRLFSKENVLKFGKTTTDTISGKFWAMPERNRPYLLLTRAGGAVSNGLFSEFAFIGGN